MSPTRRTASQEAGCCFQYLYTMTMMMPNWRFLPFRKQYVLKLRLVEDQATLQAPDPTAH